MSTISNFLANYLSPAFRLTLVVLLSGGVLCISGCTEETSINTAKERPVVKAEQRPLSIDRSQLTEPVKLKAVSIRRFVAGDPKLKALVPSEFITNAREPMMIELKLEKPVDPTPRTSSPVIVLNGKPILDTWVDPERGDKLIAILPDRQLLKERNTIAAVWLGNEKQTLTQAPLIIKSDDINN